MRCPRCGRNCYERIRHNDRWDKLWCSYCGTQEPLPQTRLFGYGDIE